MGCVAQLQSWLYRHLNDDLETQ